MGRQLRVQQRRRGGAALRLADERLHHRHRVDEHAATCCASPTTARGSTTSTTRWSGTARCGWTTRRARPDAAAWRCGRPTRRRPSARPATRSSRSKTQLTGFLSYGVLEQRRAAAAVHHQLGAAADRAAARQRRCRGARLLDEPEPGVAPHDRLAVQRALPPLRLRQPDAARRASRSSSTTTRRSTTRHRRPELYAHSRTTFDADATWSGLQPLALTVGYTHNSNGYDFRIFESSGENVFRAVGRRGGLAVGSRSGLSTRSAAAAAPGLDEEALIEIGEQPAMRHYDLADRTRNRFTGQVDIVPNDVWTFSVSGGVGKDDYDDSYFGLQESTVAHVLARRRLPPAERPGRRRHLQLRALCRTAAIARTASRGRAVQRSAARLDGGLDGDGPLLLDLRDAAPHRPQHRGAVLVRLQPRGRQLPLHDSRGQPDCRRPIQLPEVFNKLQQLHIDVRHRLTNIWRRPSRTSTSRSASTTSRSIPASSTASSSPARW